MYSDGSNFMQRAAIFEADLKSGKYPNATSLSEACGCSKNTAQRAIDKMREEFAMPIEYDASKKGFYLTDPDFSMPFQNASREELTALLIMQSLSALLHSRELDMNLATLWSRFAAGSKLLTKDLEKLTTFFSSDLTSVSEVTRAGVLEFLDTASSFDAVAIVYQSPWLKEKQPKTHRVKILKVRFSDGSLYLLVQNEKGNEFVLNAAFIEEYKKIDDFKGVSSGAPNGEDWNSGFGIWRGEAQEVTLRILPPASAYYAGQSWHAGQIDSWDDDTLVRKIPSSISPEIRRRILSLGSCLESVEPEELRETLKEELKVMLERL